MMFLRRFKICKSIESFVLLVFLINFHEYACDCNTNTCDITQHKRCYSYQKANSTEPTLSCECLKGLHYSNGSCYRVKRYDLSFNIQINPLFFDQAGGQSKLINMFNNFPVSIIQSSLSLNYAVKIENEFVLFRDSGLKNNPTMIAYIKLVIFKPNTNDINDVPAISLDQMRQAIGQYFQASLTFDPSKNQTKLNDLVINYSNQNNFVPTWNLDYNIWTCQSDAYNYCDPNSDCYGLYGSVGCSCNSTAVKEQSPEPSSFPGEVCIVASQAADYLRPCPVNFCENDGFCWYKNNVPTCYCVNRFVGDYCQIDLILYIIVAILILGLLFTLAMIAGILLALYKKKKSSSNQQRRQAPNNRSSVVDSSPYTISVAL